MIEREFPFRPRFSTDGTRTPTDTAGVCNDINNYCFNLKISTFMREFTREGTCEHNFIL